MECLQQWLCFSSHYHLCELELAGWSVCNSSPSRPIVVCAATLIHAWDTVYSDWTTHNATVPLYLKLGTRMSRHSFDELSLHISKRRIHPILKSCPRNRSLKPLRIVFDNLTTINSAISSAHQLLFDLIYRGYENIYTTITGLSVH